MNRPDRRAAAKVGDGPRQAGMTDVDVNEFATFLRAMVKSANGLQSHLRSAPEAKRMGIIRATIESSKMAFAVWNDPGAQFGVGFKLIKGHRIARECVADDKGVTSSLVGIPCVDEEQAVALVSICGDASSGLQ